MVAFYSGPARISAVPTTTGLAPDPELRHHSIGGIAGCLGRIADGAVGRPEPKSRRSSRIALRRSAAVIANWRQGRRVSKSVRFCFFATGKQPREEGIQLSSPTARAISSSFPCAVVAFSALVTCVSIIPRVDISLSR